MREPIREQLRALPSVEEAASALGEYPAGTAIRAARAEIAALRARILAGEDPDADAGAIRAAVAARAGEMKGRSLRRVVNATGVILHTNLGRAPLAKQALDAVDDVAAGYSNLEFDLNSGERGSRHDHVEPLIREISGADAAIAVNNNAAAVLLALAATAAGRDVMVSRGELIEIGGSFRIPEILALSGAKLIEVGTTNRTRIGDYESAINPDSAAILHVHQSNFRTVGFTEHVPTRDLASLARRRDLRLIDDIGSGAYAPVADEPQITVAVAAGADIVCFSADKLLGGPQAGLLAGHAEAIEKCRNHPLARALRLDKLQLAALEATLTLHLEGRAGSVPVLAMLAAEDAKLEARAARLAARIGDAATVARSTGRPGGGTLPTVELEGPVCLIHPGELGADSFVASLRRGEPPVIARISESRVVLDPRTMSDADIDHSAALAREIIGEV
jgi:L-seryl-tRNA(Ser) seleniumtransferase